MLEHQNQSTAYNKGEFVSHGIFNKMTMKQIGFLLVACLAIHLNSRHNALDALSCWPGKSSKLSGESNYARFANYLYSKTKSSELKENTVVAWLLLTKKEYSRADDQFKGIVDNFIYNDDSSYEWRRCSMLSIKHLRSLAEAMHRDGNQAPHEITEPIRRLNRLIIELIKKAISVCVNYLDMELVKMHTPYGRLPRALDQLALLGALPTGFVFKGYPGWPESPGLNNDRDAGQTWLTIIQRERKLSYFPVQHDEGWDRESLVQQLDNFSQACRTLTTSHQSKSVLTPYLDLVVISRIAAPATKLMDKFYEDAGEVPEINIIQLIPDIVRRYAECNKFMSLDKQHLAGLIERERRAAIDHEKL